MNGRITILILLVSLFSISMSLGYEPPVLECQGAYSEYCFNGPDSADDYQTFDDAMLWCQNRSSQLLVISDKETRDIASRFLDSWRNSSTLPWYINMKLRFATHWMWYLANGSEFKGDITLQENKEYKLYNSVQFTSSSSVPPWQNVASKPEIPRQYICEFNGNGSFCTLMNNSFLYEDRCYVKYENDAVNWFEARKRCISDGGDLATFNYPSRAWYIGPPFDTSKWDQTLSYWVGIRYNNLSWMSPPDAQNESMFYNWSSGKPNNFSYFCACLDPAATPRWSWTDCDCQVKRPFLCFAKIQTTTPTTRTSTTTNTATTTQLKISAESNSKTMDSPPTVIIAVVVGVVGGVIILAVVIIVVVCIITRRRRGHARNSGNGDNPTKQSARTGEYIEAEAIKGSAADNPEKVTDGEHLKKENGKAIQEKAELYAEVIPGSGSYRDSLKGGGREEITYDDLKFCDKNKDQNQLVKSRIHTVFLPEESTNVYENYAEEHGK